MKGDTVSRCAVCRHPRRAEIDAELVAGEPVRHVARRFGLCREYVRRHAEDHVPDYIVVVAPDAVIQPAAPHGD